MLINDENYMNITPTQKMLYRELFKKSFYDFVKFFWSSCDPAPFIDGKLVQYLCESYQYMVRHWVEYEEINIDVPTPNDNLRVVDIRENKNNYNVNLPPRHSKSMIFSVLGQVFVWLSNPVLAASVSHTSSLSTELNQKKQRLINSEKFKFFFPEIVLEANSASMIKDTRGGQLYAISRNALLGRGVSIISNDDLVNAEQARLDKQEMESAWQYYTQTMPSRVNDPSKYLILNICQRLQKGDITGRILQNPALASSYTFVVLPAQFSVKTIFVCPISGDLIVYEAGEYLWPERFCDYSGLRLQVGESTFKAQYLQDPSSADDSIVTEEMIHEANCTDVLGWDKENECINPLEVDCIYSSNDLPCKKTDKSDFLGSVIAYRIKKKLYIVDCIEEKQNIIDSVNYVRKLSEDYPCIIQIVEDKAGGIQLLDILNDELPGLQPFDPGLDSKEQRMENALPYLDSNNVIFVKTKWDEKNKKWILSDRLQNLKDRLLAFPFVSHDDICDALSMLILYVFADARFSVYGKSFNEYNLFNSSAEHDYSTTFFIKEGDNWKCLDIGIKYDIDSKMYVMKEYSFVANIEQGLKILKEFTPDKNVFINCSVSDELNGIYLDDIILEKYEPDDIELSVGKLNVAFSNKKVLINQYCKQTQSDIDNFKYSKKDPKKFRNNSDGFVRCIRVAMKYFGDI